MSPLAGIRVPEDSDNPEANFTGIRPFDKKDQNDVGVILGLGTMEGLTMVNKMTYFNPVVIAFWAITALALDYYMGWWPEEGVPLSWGIAASSIGFGAVALPILMISELLNRDYFEAAVRLMLGSKDMIDISSYYNDPATPSAFAVLLHRGGVVGCIGIDAITPGEKLESVIPAVNAKDRDGLMSLWGWMGKKGDKDAGDKKKASEKASIVEAEKEVEKETKRREGLRSRKGANSSSTAVVKPTQKNIAELRHLVVDSPYRRKEIATDLMNSALAQTFGAGSPVEEVIFAQTYATGTPAHWFLRKRGFTPVPVEEAEKAGWRELPTKTIFGKVYTGKWWRLKKETWLKVEGDKLDKKDEE